MQFSVFIAALLAVGVNSKAIADVDVGTSGNEIFRRDSFDCNGNSLCGVAVNFVRDCDIAVNQQIIRDNNGNYGAPGSGRASGAQRGECRISILGEASCTRSGNEIWNDYQEIRRAGCGRCGSKHWGSRLECRTTINWAPR